MSMSCDFRKVLDVYPEQNTCVGIVKTAKGGPRACTERLNVTSRDIAKDIMSTINRQQDASLQDIEDLASVMLCKEQHNNDLKPHLSQVDEVCVKWEARIEHYKQIAEKEAAAAAMLKSKRELARLKKEAEDLMSNMSTDRQEQMSPSKHQSIKASSPRKEAPARSDASMDAEFVAPKAHRVSLRAQGHLSIFPSGYTKDSPSRQPSPRLPSPGFTSPRLPSPGFTSPRLPSPGFASPRLPSPGFTSPRIPSPGFTSPGVSSPGLSSPGLLSPALSSPASSPPDSALPRIPSPRQLPAFKFDEADRDTWCLLIQRPPTPPGTPPPTSRPRVHEKMDNTPPRPSALRKNGRSRSATTPSMTSRPKSVYKANYLPEPKTPSKSVSFESLSRRSQSALPLSVASSDFGFASSLQGPLPDFDFAFVSDLPELRTSIAVPQEDSPTLARRTSGFDFGSSYKIPPKSFEFERSTPISAQIDQATAIWNEFVATSDAMRPAVPEKNRKSLPDTPESMMSHFVASPKSQRTISQSRSKELPETPLSLQSAKYIERHTRATSSPQFNSPSYPPPEPPTRISTPPRALSQRRLLSTPPLAQGQFSSLPSPRLLATPKASPTPSPRLSPRPSFTELRPEPTNPNRLSAILATLPPLPTKMPTSHTFDYGYGYATITPTAPHKTFSIPAAGLAPVIEVQASTFDELSSPFPDFTIKKELRQERTKSIPRKPVPAPIVLKEDLEVFTAECGERTPRTPRSNDMHPKGLGMRRWRKRVGRQIDGLKIRVVGVPEKRIENVVAGVGLRAASFGVQYSSLPRVL